MKLTKELDLNNEEIDQIVNSLNKQKRISISYIQKQFNYGFPKASKVFNYLVGRYILEDGTVIKQNKSGLKLIFLDVDGVLNCHSTKDRCGQYIGIEDSKVKLLKEIVDWTNAKLVLVSTWKEWWFKEDRLKDRQDDLATYLDEKLAKQGLVIYDKTNDYNSINRGKGILRYIELLEERGNFVDKFVILDDETFDYLKSKTTKYLVRTSFDKNGLEKKHVRKVIEKLC